MTSAMQNEQLLLLNQDECCTLYSIPGTIPSKLSCFISTTPQSRSVCNDPSVMGIAYTEALKAACAATLRAFRAAPQCVLREEETVVLHILRGGLNFGLREAVAQAFSWNAHVSAFVSAQRQRQTQDPEKWEIIEREYRKVYLPATASIVFGDVVATGTSLRYGLEQLQTECETTAQQLRSVVFFTIGAGPTEAVLNDFDIWARQRYSAYEGTSVIYFEGRFGVATAQSALRIKYTGTDLIREGALMAPEFIASQAAHASYPIERCTVYDAGSRAFWLPEYKQDVIEYWHQVAALATEGLSYREYLQERYPDAPAGLVSDHDLRQVALSQLEKFSS